MIGIQNDLANKKAELSDYVWEKILVQVVLLVEDTQYSASLITYQKFSAWKVLKLLFLVFSWI